MLSFSFDLKLNIGNNLKFENQLIIKKTAKNDKLIQLLMRKLEWLIPKPKVILR